LKAMRRRRGSGTAARLCSETRAAAPLGLARRDEGGAGRWESGGCAAGFIGADEGLGVRAKAETRRRGRAGLELKSGSGGRSGTDQTGGSHPSAGAGERRRGRAGRGERNWAG
jgi:hypothetical protein